MQNLNSRTSNNKNLSEKVEVWSNFVFLLETGTESKLNVFFVIYGLKL